MGYEVSFGGRFLHLCDSYNKGKAVKEFLTILISYLYLSSCASYYEMVPSWAEICSDPVDKSKAAWYKPCNLSAPKFEKILKD